MRDMDKMRLTVDHLYESHIIDVEINLLREHHYYVAVLHYLMKRFVGGTLFLKMWYSVATQRVCGNVYFWLYIPLALGCPLFL